MFRGLLLSDIRRGSLRKCVWGIATEWTEFLSLGNRLRICTEFLPMLASLSKGQRAVRGGLSVSIRSDWRSFRSGCVFAQIGQIGDYRVVVEKLSSMEEEFSG